MTQHLEQSPQKHRRFASQTVSGTIQGTKQEEDKSDKIVHNKDKGSLEE